MPLSRRDTVFCTPPLADRPFLDMLAPVKAAGFTALSIAPPQLFALQAQGVGVREVRTRIADSGLALAEFDAITCWLPGHAPKAGMEPDFAELLMQLTPERLFPMASELGARSITVVEILGASVDLDVAAEAFGGICDEARSHGLLAHIEFIPAGGIRNLAMAAEIVRRADRPNGGITLDTLHFFRGGGSLEELSRIPAERIITVQLADAPAEAPTDLAGEMMAGRLTPGEGGLDIAGVVRTLDRIGAQAPLGVEVFNPAVAVQPIDTTARQWMNGLRSVVQQAGAGQ